MKSLYILRTNLTTLESYHSIKNLKEFKEKCWDFYLMQGLWFLENNYFDEVIIWRLSTKKINDIVFNVGGKKFIQRWVLNFNEIFNYPKPAITFFRGGFPEYCQLTKKDPDFFGMKLYLAAGKRLTPQYGGNYDKILIECEKDKIPNCLFFYKTTNKNIFKSLQLEKKYDLCIISNFTQLKYKGTEFIFQQISNSKFLKSLKICHIGNKPKVGNELLKKYGITNVECLGHLERTEVNKILNQSKYGIVNSNRNDGCPRVITEILTSGTPMLINEETRVLKFYKKFGVIEFNNTNFLEKIQEAFQEEIYKKKKEELLKNIDCFEMKSICFLNLYLWSTIH